MSLLAAARDGFVGAFKECWWWLGQLLPFAMIFMLGFALGVSASLDSQLQKVAESCKANGLARVNETVINCSIALDK